MGRVIDYHGPCHVHKHEKKCRGRVRGSAVVEKELRESLEAEEQLFRMKRVELQDAM